MNVLQAWLCRLIGCPAPPTTDAEAERLHKATERLKTSNDRVEEAIKRDTPQP